MNRDALSRPPSDEMLLDHILDDFFGRMPRNGVVSMAKLVGETARQLPGAVPRERIRAAILDRASGSGLAIDFDERQG
jgi:hypothetical protein